MVKQFVLTALSSPGVLHHLGWEWIRVSRERLILRLKLNNCYEKLSRDCATSITSKLVRINVKARMKLSHQNSGVWPTNTTTFNCTAIQGAKYFSFLETRPSSFGSFLSKLSTEIYLNINQLDALNFVMSLFHASTCFEHTCSSSGGQNCTIQPLVSSHLLVAVPCTG